MQEERAPRGFTREVKGGEMSQGGLFNEKEDVEGSTDEKILLSVDSLQSGRMKKPEEVESFKFKNLGGGPAAQHVREKEGERKGD